MKNRLNMRKKAEGDIDIVIELLKEVPIEITNPENVREFLNEITEVEIPNLHYLNYIILEHMVAFPHSFIENWKIYVTEEYGLESFSEELARKAIGEVLGELYKQKAKPPIKKELTEEKIEVPYSELLNKYTEDEIFDIAAGKKTDVTAEEVELAKDVITRGIVANRLSMRKTTSSYQNELRIVFAKVEKEDFWSIIQRAGKNPKKLKIILGQLSIEDVVQFEDTFFRYSNAIRDGKSGEALEEAGIGVSFDDSADYCSWAAVWAGQKVYRKCVRDPDFYLEFSEGLGAEGEELAEELTGIMGDFTEEEKERKRQETEWDKDIYQTKILDNGWEVSLWGFKAKIEKEMYKEFQTSPPGTIYYHIYITKQGFYEEEPVEYLFEKDYFEDPIDNLAYKAEIYKEWEGVIAKVQTEDPPGYIKDFLDEMESKVKLKHLDPEDSYKETLEEYLRGPWGGLVEMDPDLTHILVTQLRNRGIDISGDILPTAEEFQKEGKYIITGRLSMRKFSQSTPETIQKAQAGDGDAIAQVVEENTGLIASILIKWGYTPGSADFEDLMSDVKFEMLNKVIPRYDPARGAFSTFLSTAVVNNVLKNKAQKERERKEKEVSLTEPIGDEITYEDILEDPTSPLAQLTLSGIREGFQTWLHTESPKLEDVILRIFDLKLQEYPHEQIAEILNQEGYTSKGKPVTKNMVSNYFRKWIKPALAQYFEAFRTASLNMRKKAQEEEEPLRPKPQVTKQELIRLYKQEAKGIYDEELMDFIISNFVHVLEGWIEWNEQEIEDNAIKEQTEEIKEQTEDNYNFIRELENLIQPLLQAKTSQEKMLAIDWIINIFHHTGKEGEYLIKGIEPGDLSFFEELRNLKISSLSMRKKVYG